MIKDIYELSLKEFLGETLTIEEKQTVQQYNSKYNEVCRLVIEDRRSKNMQITDFHFTPGDKFLETPVKGIVETLLNSFLTAQPYDFGDKTEFHMVSNPPLSGKLKSTLL